MQHQEVQLPQPTSACSSTSRPAIATHTPNLKERQPVQGAIAESPQPYSARATTGPVWYDEYAIGWNELFEEKAFAAAAAAADENADERPTAWQLPDAMASSGLTLPKYRKRGRHAQQAIVEQCIKDKLVVCSLHQLRKPADVMEGELKQLRSQVLLAEQKQRTEVRRTRRLMRKCRVRDHEDLEELEANYPSQLDILDDPADATPRLGVPTKDFFHALGKKRSQTPRSAR
mmetsp:Transcript_25152/g.46104  ORF Transcript_25152/g.46104 Transcript_25152/m.46104 type:complete len:231 (-) Transcript_25152:98-790(-)